MGFLRERFSKGIQNNNHSRIIFHNDYITRLVKTVIMWKNARSRSYVLKGVHWCGNRCPYFQSDTIQHYSVFFFNLTQSGNSIET